MGSCSSSVANRSKRNAVGSQEIRFNSSGHVDSTGRIEMMQETKALTLGGLKIRYAYISLRGYYPDDLKKLNQDAVSVTLNFADRGTDAHFAVFDGHGKCGDRCAQFASKHLAETIAKHVTKSRSNQAKKNRSHAENTRTSVADEDDDLDDLEVSQEQTQLDCHDAHVQLNTLMHRNSAFDDSLSGTTAISCLVEGRKNRITICNVGDSRAVLGRRGSRSKSTSCDYTHDDLNLPATILYQALALSRDQTPYRRDERRRIRATGARILSLDQIEGLEPIDQEEEELDKRWFDSNIIGNNEHVQEEIDVGGDPPRVWSANGEYPGTAFTRSLGDSIAEKLGVYAEPEILTLDLSEDDKIIVLASDGVFEFLTNQSVIDICAKFSDPMAACRAVVAESFELWLQYELRSDDITMLCIFIDEVDWTFPAVPDVSSPTSRAKFNGFASLSALLGNITRNEFRSDGKVIVDDCASKILRRSRPKRGDDTLAAEIKRRITTGVESNNNMHGNVNVALISTEKTSEEAARIKNSIGSSIIFRNLTDSQRDLIIKLIEPIEVKKGDWIIRQGIAGDRFYIVDDGKFEVRLLPDGHKDLEGTGGNVIHVFIGSRTNQSNAYFGELALIKSSPRSASVIAQTDGHLWALHRYAFRQALLESTT